jgi:hypothetical protein
MQTDYFHTENFSCTCNVEVKLSSTLFGNRNVNHFSIIYNIQKYCMIIGKKRQFVESKLYFKNLLRHQWHYYCIMTLCYLCSTRAASMECSECKRPVCKNCTKDFPFSSSACLECAETIKTGLGGIRKDEEIF